MGSPKIVNGCKYNQILHSHELYSIKTCLQLRLCVDNAQQLIQTYIILLKHHYSTYLFKHFFLSSTSHPQNKYIKMWYLHHTNCYRIKLINDYDDDDGRLHMYLPVNIIKYYIHMNYIPYRHVYSNCVANAQIRYMKCVVSEVLHNYL